MSHSVKFEGSSIPAIMYWKAKHFVADDTNPADRLPVNQYTEAHPVIPAHGQASGNYVINKPNVSEI